jgi:tRNA(Ile)-lysidine synthase
MESFDQQVSAFIDEHRLLPGGCRVLAGVSGGADSLALLILLTQLRNRRDLRLAVAHLNHGLRGEAADADEIFVQQWCERLDVPFFSSRIDLVGLADQRGKGLEETGRQERLDYFNLLAERFEAAGFPGDTVKEQRKADDTAAWPVRIALAHHLDDQAETLLMHLGRGCGLDGLVGMKAQSGRVIRPFLQQSRQSIEQWLSGQQISWQQDQSNQDPFALRNRLRHQVLPAWRQALGYDPAPLLKRTAASLAEDQALLDELAREAAVRCLSPHGLKASELLLLAPALQNRLLRLFWQDSTGSGRDLARTHLLALRNWLPTARSGQRLSLPGRWAAWLDGDGLISLLHQAGEPTVQDDRLSGEIASLEKGSNPGYPEQYSLTLPGLTRIDAWNLETEADLIENDGQIVYNDAMEYFRLDRIAGSVVRHRLPGDYIRPYGRLGGKTLKKFLNEQKIPSERRNQLLMIAKGRDIVWLSGSAAGARFVGRPGDGWSGPLIRIVWHWLKPVDIR